MKRLLLVTLLLASSFALAQQPMRLRGDLKPGAYVGSTAVKKGEQLVALEVHVLPPAAAPGHTPWDLEPGSTMTNANLAGVVKVSGGNEITLNYKDGFKPPQ